MYITTDNLTIVGAGIDETIIGPAGEGIDYQHFSPKCIWAGDIENLAIGQLTIRNCYTGTYGSTYSNRVEYVKYDTINIGLFIQGEILDVGYCSFIGVGNSTNSVVHLPNCRYSRVHNCNFRGCSVYIESVEDYAIRDCAFNEGQGAVSVLDGSVGTIERCTVNNPVNVGFNIDTSRCTMNNVEIAGGRSGLWLQGGEFVGAGLTITGTSLRGFYVFDPTYVSVHGSNIIPASGWAIYMETWGQSPSYTYDFSGNYWGVTDSTAVATSIWDGHDSDSINDYIDFTPFELQLEVQRQTMGAIKALFR